MKNDNHLIKVLGLYTYVVLLSSLIGDTIIYSEGYCSGFIYIIGNDAQIISLFEGLAIGIIVFSFLGYIIGSSGIKRFIGGFVAGVLLFFLVDYIIHAVNFVVPDTLLMIVSFLITAPFLPLLQFSRTLVGRTITFGKGLLVPAGISIISIITIAILAIEYEASGQSNLAQIVGMLNYMAIAALFLVVVLYFLSTGNRKSNANVRR
jgi:hypothetical protein